MASPVNKLLFKLKIKKEKELLKRYPTKGKCSKEKKMSEHVQCLLLNRDGFAHLAPEWLGI